MIFFFYGKDQYRLRRKINEIIEYYKQIHKNGLNLRCFDLKEKRFQDFENELQSASMFKERKLIILENTSFNQEFKEKFSKEIKKSAQSKEIILFSEEELPKDIFFRSLKKYAKIQEFEPLDEEKLKVWVKKEFQKSKTEIEDLALEKLLESTDDNLWQIDNEIQKLVSYKNRGKIKLKDVESLVKAKIESDIFKTIDAIAQRNKRLALQLLHKHLEKGDSPSYLFSMINFQFRNLLMIKSQIQSKNYFQRITDISEELGIHPYVVGKTIRQTQKFTLEELKKIYKKIFKTDLDIKTGRIDPQAALDLLVAEL